MSDDDDDEEKQEAKYEFSEESKLDEDHLFYLQFTNNFISNVTRPRDFDHCTRWLERLAGEPMYGVPAKRNRNMYLAMLLCAMQDNKVKGPFSSFPPPGPLKSAAVAFGLTGPEDEDTGSMLFDETDRELNMSEYKYKSRDGRTYIATCALPNNGGVMAFVGLTFGGGEGLWINKLGVQVKNRDEERLQVVTPKTPLRKQIEWAEEHRDRLSRGLDQIVPELGDDAYKFLTDLPLSTSDSNLLELGSYKYSPENYELLSEIYPIELVDVLQDFLVVSKKEIEKRLRARHDRVIKNFYAEYSAEIERGLREYKEARVEWATVYQVVAELKETLALKEAKDAESSTAYADSGNRPTGVLVASLNDAKKRQKIQYETGQELDAKKVELHKEIHDRALFHMHEIEKMQRHVDKISGELCNLRRDARKKQMVIQSLYMQTGRTMR